jgi:PKD repeat protein
MRWSILVALIVSLTAAMLTACGPTIPEASFTASPTEGAAPLSVQFTDTSLNEPVSWKWDFGDGSNSTDKSPSHAFEITGTYDVTLVATNDAGSGNSTSTRSIG